MQKLQKSEVTKKVVACSLICSLSMGIGTFNAYASDRMIGDVNDDGRLSGMDAYLVLRHSAGYSPIEDNYYADLSKDNRLSAIDALMIQRLVVGYKDSELYARTNISLVCGDRTNLDPQVTPYEANEGITYSYELDKSLSSDGSGYPVLKLTNNGLIKAFHPGTSVVTIKASNGTETKCTVVVENKEKAQFIRVGNNRLSLVKKLQTLNDAYNYSQELTELKGLVIHSSVEKGFTSREWYNKWNTGGTGSAVHTFVDNVMAYQCLPYEQVGWHAGSSYNKTHLGVSICISSDTYYDTITGKQVDYSDEELQEYFNNAWRNAVTYSAYICKQYGLSADDVVGHNELPSENNKGYSDPEHWFKLHGKSMNDFRNDVNTLLSQ